MLNQNVQLWLQALRSGKYKKCEETLRELDDMRELDDKGRFAYCALGVAMKVAQDHGIHFHESEWEAGFLPTPVIDWLGLKKRDNDNLKLNSVSVTDLNDGAAHKWNAKKHKYFSLKPMGFKKIASEIEKHPEVFTQPRVGKISKKAKKKVV